MKKKFGDLKTGDVIYYIAWDEEEKVFKVFEHEVFVCDVSYTKITIAIQLRSGDYISHGISNLCLDNEETTRIWNHPTTILIDNSVNGGLAVSVDYEEAKRVCLKFMFAYCKILTEKCNDMTYKMNNAMLKMADMERKFNNI